MQDDASFVKHNVQFQNKALPRPITSKFVQQQHQLDLVDMRRDAVTHQGVVYKYILSLMDIFSRYVWLRPLNSKNSKDIALILKGIYDKHGKPDILQMDNGKEFKGKVLSLCKSLKIRVINSRPYHPQAQGKVERVHRSLHNKMRYDLLKRKHGVNWVRALPNYTRILNEDPKEELASMSPFEVYCGRKPNSGYSNTNVAHLCESFRFPKRNQVKQSQSKRVNLSKRAELATNKMNKRMISKFKRLYKVEDFHVGQHVMVKVQNKFHKIAPKKRLVCEGQVLKQGKGSYYQVQYLDPLREIFITEFFSVDNIASTSSKQMTKIWRKLKYKERKMSTEKNITYQWNKHHCLHKFNCKGRGMLFLTLLVMVIVNFLQFASF